MSFGKYVLELEDDGYDIASSYGISFCGKDCCVMVRETKKLQYPAAQSRKCYEV